MVKLKHVLLFESYHGLSKSEIRELEAVGVLPKWFEDPQEMVERRPDLEVDEENGRIKSKTYGWVLDMAARTVTFEELGEEPIPFEHEFTLSKLPEGKANVTYLDLLPAIVFLDWRGSQIGMDPTPEYNEDPDWR